MLLRSEPLDAAADQDGQVRSAVEEMQGRLGNFGALRFLVQKFLPGGRELIVGATASRGLGHLVMFGLGGIYVEVLKDVAFKIAPVTRVEAREMLESVKTGALLEGIRGSRGVDKEAVVDLVDRVRRSLGPIDILVNGAGPFAMDPFKNLPEADWDRVMDANLKSIYMLSRQVAVDMAARGWGRIINVASINGKIGSLHGAAVGGLLLGVLESLSGGLISSQFKDATAFLVLLLVLFLRPHGLLGRGSVARNHTNMKRNTNSFNRNHTNGHRFSGPNRIGPAGPPRNSVTMIADVVIVFMNEAR